MAKISKEGDNNDLVTDDNYWNDFVEYHYGKGRVGVQFPCWRGEMGSSRVGGSKNKESLPISSKIGPDDGDEL